jgi:uncharacterized membrane protein
MNTRVLCLAVVIGTACAAPLSAQEYIPLPQGSWANDVTPDGSVVVGDWNFGDSFIWNIQQDPAPTIVTGGGFVAISDDGEVAAGNIIDPGTGANVAAIWTAIGGWQSLGWLPNALSCPSRSTAYDISGDGTTIVGLSWDGCDARGFRWTEATGMQELQPLANGGNRCSTISGDGTALGGFAQGAFSRTPAYWAADMSGAVLDETFQGEVHGFNEDGSTSVGTNYFSGNWYSAFVRDTASGVMTNLGSLNHNWAGHATDITEDGNIIVGYDVNGLSRQAWVWTSTGGILSLNDRLTALGITGAEALFVCRAVSDDGAVIVGGGVAAGGGPFGTAGFIVTLTNSQWTGLGGGTAGINGMPGLSGSGSLVGGSTATLELTDAPANALMLAWLSFSSVPQSFFGGTIHATPFANQFLFSADAAGSFAASTTWPNGVPSGTEVWFQFIVQDLSVIHGLTLSNGLKATTP